MRILSVQSIMWWLGAITMHSRGAPLTIKLLVVFFSLLSLLPVCLTASIANFAHTPAYRFGSLIWLAAIIALAVYANRRCSSDQMSFRGGLLWVTASMMTGWMYMSFVTVLPVLLFAFCASVFYAIRGDFSRDAKYSPRKWHSLVSYFYRRRMRQ